MRKLGLLSASIATAALLAGCGGGGGGSSSKVTRTVAGFVYVLGGTGTANPNAIIIPSAVAPAGFFAPTSGTVSLSVPDGSISRAPDNEPFNMATSNAVICSVSANEGTLITTSGSGLNFEGNARSFSAFTTNIGTKVNSGTVLVLNNGGATYTPGAPASLIYTIGGVPLDNPPADPVQFVTGAPAAATTLNVVALDESGVIVPGTQFTVAASNAGVTVGGSPGAGPFSLTPGGMAQAEGAVDITIDTTGANLQATINGNFTHGTATTVTVGASVPTIWWNTTTSTDTPVSATMTATVFNQFGVAMPNVPVSFATDKIPSAGNAWSAVDAGLSGNAFATQAGNTDVNGQFVSTFAPPANIDGPLTTPQKAPKNANVVSATSGSASGNTTVTILRPIGALVITGPSRLDVGTNSSVAGGQAYLLTGATDVDNDAVTIPAGSVTWARTNVVLAGTVGNTGDTTAKSTSNSTINSGSGVLSAGTVAGQVTVTASIGSVSSNVITTEIFGTPSKIFLNPDTGASVIPGARGEYVFAGVGNTQAASFTLLDSAGHSVPAGEYNGFTSVFTIQALTGGSITPGGVNVSGFTVTCGNTDGLFTLQVNGSWVGAQGGSGPINLTRDVGQNAP